MTFNKLKPGMTVWHVGKTRMGNTTLTCLAIWPVRIIEVHPETQSVTASWNCNPAKKFYSRQWEKWRIKKPETVINARGRRELAPRRKDTPKN